MKAIVLNSFGSVEEFKLKEVEQPKPEKNEVLIKIRATAFNPIDYQIRQGATESKLLKSPILGRELSGDIIALGDGVSAFKIGDRVSAYVGSLASNGTYTEFISVPEELLAKNAVNINYEESTAIPMVGMTALQCINRLSIPDETPLFITGGAGGVGTMLIKLLLANGKQQVYTTAGNKESILHLRNIGLAENQILDYRNNNLVAELRSKANTNFFGYTIDLVGNKMSEVCAELLDVFGTYVDVTFLATEKARESLFDKAATILNIANYAPSLKGDNNSLSYYGKGLNQLFQLIEKSTISPTAVNIVGNLSLETVKQAHLMMESNKTNGKKLVMTVS